LIFLGHILNICKNQEQICHIFPIRFCKHVHNSGPVGLNFSLLMQLLIHVCQHYVFVFSKRLLPTSCRSWCGDATIYDPLKVKVSTLRFIPFELVALKF
jgi:hypothetical protein